AESSNSDSSLIAGGFPVRSLEAALFLLSFRHQYDGKPVRTFPLISVRIDDNGEAVYWFCERHSWNPRAWVREKYKSGERVTGTVRQREQRFLAKAERRARQHELFPGWRP